MNYPRLPVGDSPIETQPRISGYPSEDRSGDGDDLRSVGGPHTAEECLGPAEFAVWLESRGPELRERWANEIVARGLGQATRVDRVVIRLVHQIVALLPSMLGSHRGEVEPLWVRSSELFGVIAAKRGLAAGEVIEEFQILRELVIRDLYEARAIGSPMRLSLREILRLNKTIDRGVTYASVGHTDAMFFQFFEADGQATISVDDLVVEAETQLSKVGEELRSILSTTGPRDRPSP